MDSKCELCILRRINQEFYRCDDFIIISCENCNIPMVVPFEHIRPGAPGHHKLRDRMEIELTKVAYRFYSDFKFFIDKKENKIPDHMHWHARRLDMKTSNEMHALKNEQILKISGIIK